MKIIAAAHQHWEDLINRTVEGRHSSTICATIKTSPSLIIEKESAKIVHEVPIDGEIDS